MIQFSCYTWYCSTLSLVPSSHSNMPKCITATKYNFSGEWVSRRSFVSFSSSMWNVFFSLRMFIGALIKYESEEIKLALKQFRERSIYYRSRLRSNERKKKSFYSSTLLSVAENVKLDEGREVNAFFSCGERGREIFIQTEYFMSLFLLLLWFTFRSGNSRCRHESEKTAAAVGVWYKPERQTFN